MRKARTPIAFSGEFMSEYKGEGYYATAETVTVNPENGNLSGPRHVIDPFGAMDRKYNDDRMDFDFGTDRRRHATESRL